jgi:7,8-dihydropterin-6-yl-methyl-4-(beta-D-ribofuranosyl)aminobenzene 5'-phosphate synthase
MERTQSPLQQVDKLEIFVVVDNYVDLRLQGNEHVMQPVPLMQGEVPKGNPLAEHGLCLLVTAYKGSERHSILFDTGRTDLAASHNLAYFGADLKLIEAIVLSHGHSDHTGGLMAILDMLDDPVEVIAHPDGYAHVHNFYLDDEPGVRVPKPFAQNDLERRGGKLVENKTPLLLAADTILVTGEIPRLTAFEQAQIRIEIEKNGRWQPDLILDDQALVVDLKHHGLVVITGCGHAGIINTLLYSRQLTGKNRLHAAMGGFHLCEPGSEALIENTITELTKLRPKILVPMHCTGWQATLRLAQKFPSAFIRTSVGSKIVLGE